MSLSTKSDTASQRSTNTCEKRHDSTSRTTESERFLCVNYTPLSCTYLSPPTKRESSDSADSSEIRISAHNKQDKIALDQREEAALDEFHAASNPSNRTRRSIVLCGESGSHAKQHDAKGLSNHSESSVPRSGEAGSFRMRNKSRSLTLTELLAASSRMRFNSSSLRSRDGSQP